MSADPRLARFTASRVAHWNGVAGAARPHSPFAAEYHRRLTEVYRFLLPAGLRLLEIGSAEGDLLGALQPQAGTGVDFAPEMVRRASTRHPAGHLRFVQADAHDLSGLEGPFDAIIMSDLLNDVFDVQQVLVQARRLCQPHTRLVLNLFSHLWELPLRAAAAAGLARPKLQQNWLTRQDVRGLLLLAGFELVDQRQDVLLPVPVPGLRSLANRYAAQLWPLRYLALTNIFVARPIAELPARPTVSVIVPARNESGNIDRILEEVPEMGGGTEIVFVEGHSKDDTYQAIEAAMAKHPARRCSLYRQQGEGKGDAVRLGFERAAGDILMILDADLTVAPRDLVRFFDVISSGKGEFVNGVRLVYPMEQQAMRFLNLVGNKFFSAAFSWLLGQSIRDTLCGTKVLWARDYENLARNRSYFGDFDPFGDFDLLFGAAKLSLKIVEVPIRYGARTYGETNIRRWRHGLLLLRMVVFAARRIRFI